MSGLSKELSKASYCESMHTTKLILNSLQYVVCSFLVISCQSSEMAARTTFPKKHWKICALVPQKARAWAVTSLEININSCCWRKILYISCMQDSSSEAWWEWLAAHYDQDQKEPFLRMKKVLINCKLRVYAKQLTRNYKPTAACIN